MSKKNDITKILTLGDLKKSGYKTDLPSNFANHEELKQLK